jgi:hypothetical protein
MGRYEYPKDDAANVYLNPRWIAVPVSAPNSIANCYINGTGVADFSGDDVDSDPPWDPLEVEDVTFHLRFPSNFPPQLGDSPLRPSDIVLPDSIMACVGLAHINHDGPLAWKLSLESISVEPIAKGQTNFEIVVNGIYYQDAWMERIAYQIDMLIYRKEFDQPAARIDPWNYISRKYRPVHLSRS